MDDDTGSLLLAAGAGFALWYFLLRAKPAAKGSARVPRNGAAAPLRDDSPEFDTLATGGGGQILEDIPRGGGGTLGSVVTSVGASTGGCGCGCSGGCGDTMTAPAPLRGIYYASTAAAPVPGMFGR